MINCRTTGDKIVLNVLLISLMQMCLMSNEYISETDELEYLVPYGLSEEITLKNLPEQLK